jgi:hypothetical protein
MQDFIFELENKILYEIVWQGMPKDDEDGSIA